MSTYTIHSGDTLSKIAARFHTSVSALERTNHLANPNHIVAGRTLQIPGSHDSFQAAPTHGSHPSGGSSSGIHGSPALAAASRQVAAELPGTGRCAKGVEMAISRTMGFHPYGNANQLGGALLRSGRFRELHISLQQALKTPGLVLTWQSSRSALGKQFGHTAVTWGDGHTSSSDYVESNTSNAGRSGLRVFMPV
jgi:LysM repeat protein